MIALYFMIAFVVLIAVWCVALVLRRRSSPAGTVRSREPRVGIVADDQ